MKLVQARDLTRGVPVSVLSLYALPMLISMLFQQAYNLADGWIAGNYIGAAALGAVGACYPVTIFLLAISSGLSLGASIFCSQAYGAGKSDRVKTAVSTSVLGYLPLAIAVSLAGLFLAPLLADWLAVPPEARADVIAYLRIYSLGFPFQFLYSLSNGVMTGLGNSETPLLFLILSSVCNILLDYVFAAGLGLGVTGLALATVLSQGFAALVSMYVMLRLRGTLAGSGPRFSPEIMGAVLRLGVPSMIQHMLMALGQMVLQNVINGYGLIVMAGYSLAFRINGLVINSLMALSNALSGFIAQCKGAGKYDRIRAGIRAALALSYGFSACVILALRACGPALLAFFLEDSDQAPEIMAAGLRFFQVVSPFYLLVCLKIVFDGALRGIGAMTAFMAATLSDVLVRILCGDLFSTLWGLDGVWAVWPAAWLLGTILSVGAYIWFARKQRVQ